LSILYDQVRFFNSFNFIKKILLLFKTKEELQKARHDLLQSAQTPKVSLAAQSILRKVENERDSGLFNPLNSSPILIILLLAILEARTAANERDSLRERLRVNKNPNISLENL
jgi:hypothetical protein